MSEKKKSPKPEEDELTSRIPTFYKRKCELNGLTVNKALRDKL
jgi:hypothetical protein